MADDAPKIAEPGSILAGKLRVESVLGQGAMGVVYECTDTSTNTRVAVKVVSNIDDVELRARFAREVRAASSLTNDHAVKVLEVGESEGLPYLMMELLKGKSLETLVDTNGPLPISSVVDWILQAIEVVGEAHAKGLVHRDLKPANIFLSDRPGREPIVKVLDFGVVKISDPQASKLTKTGASPGTPGYMSPEQVRGLPDVDVRSDVWSLGATMFELLSGRLPFAAPTIPDMLARVLHDAPDSLREKRSDIPKEVEAIVKRCLKKDPKDRFATADDLGNALESATSGPGFTARMDRHRRTKAGNTAALPPIASRPPGPPATPRMPSAPPPGSSHSTRPPPVMVPVPADERELATAKVRRRQPKRRPSRAKVFLVSAAIALGLGAAIIAIVLANAVDRPMAGSGPTTSASAIARRHLGRDASARESDAAAATSATAPATSSDE